MKQQEKMMRDMEASVAHREAIVIRGEGQAKLYKQMLTKGEFQYKKQELMKRIKEAQRVSMYNGAPIAQQQYVTWRGMLFSNAKGNSSEAVQ